ncbi:ferrochelatase-2, chloroplastic-like [Herrania umbratica]|uniref:Ferrochelatase n=1 Tax=Herrania umbratica TaxID=108875 RepID=A0A6J1BL25_9ROSI|nr:ferrochelatase-2, chloroplastic-like [Herrania umbratica]
MRRCPHHGLPKWLQVQTFYNGFRGPFRTTIDATTRGTFMSKSIDKAYDLLEEIASNNYQWPLERLGTRNIVGIHELDVMNTVSTQLASLTKKIDKLNANAVQNSFMTCEFYGEGHSNENCPFYSESSAKSNSPPGFPSRAPMLEKKPLMEDMFMQFMTKTDAFITKTDTFITKTDAFIIKTDASIQNQTASIRNFEIQVGQLASALNTRPHGTLPSDIEPNPRREGKEHCMAITLCNGKEVHDKFQAEELRKSLWAKNVPAKVYVGMRYWHPFTEEAIEQIKKDGITKLVVLPLYPQFSISTSGSSLRLLESIFRDDEYLVNMRHTVIPSWYQRDGYIKSMANLIEKELQKFDHPEKVVIFFSAHGVPLAYVEEAGDPYKAEMEECVDLIIEELDKRKITNAYALAYQSRVGPVEWLKPYTDETIVELGRKGVKNLLAVPISFVSEHIETLEEIDVEYKELAFESGIENWGRVPALGCEPMFISDLADAVIESLPYVGAMAVSNLEARQSLVPLGSVEELLAAYDSQRRELPPPVTVWEWGWTKSAETWNGRAAMLAVLVLLLLEVTTGEGFLHQWGVLPLFR